jgi:hypothetical protein
MPDETPPPGRDDGAATPVAVGPDTGGSPVRVGQLGGPEGAGAPAWPEADPCAAEARIAEERCALADRLRILFDVARTEMRETQRALDVHGLRVDRAVATADPRAVRDRKEAAYAAFRTGRASAHDHRGLEIAAAVWLAEIDRVNHEVSAARRLVPSGQRESGRLVVELEKRTAAAAAARIAAERADHACLDARGRLAACLEMATGGAAPGLGEILGTRPAAPRTEADDDAVEPDDAATVSADDVALRRPDAHPAIVALLAGDTAVRDGIAAEIAGEDVADAPRWADRLARLADAIVDVAVEDSRFVFPRDHPFWGGFSQGECREIAVGLGALGYRPGPGGGWIDDRIPTRRDLSLAVGYAGHDSMRIRHGAADDDIARLFDGIETNVIGHLVETAGGLTLGEMVALLGRRAEGFTDLWAAWGRIRPLLLRDAGID